MPEHPNETIIRRAFAAFERGDVQTILKYCDPEAEFNCPGPSTIPYAGVMRGHAEIQNYFAILSETQTNQKLEIDQYVTHGGTVIAIGSYSAAINVTGKSFKSPCILVFHLQESKIVSALILGDTAAIAASYTATVAAAS